MIVRTEYLEKIRPFIDTPFIKILAGVRRCGKSTILKMVVEELLNKGVAGDRIIEYNFESIQYEEIKTAAALYSEIKRRLPSSEKAYLFFDEIQEVEDWEKALNSFVVDFDVDIYVTGSNSRMMSSEISTYLTGRYIQFRIYPLSFIEYLEFRKHYFINTGDSNPSLTRNEEFARYMRFGGFPAIHLREFTQDEAYTVVKDIYNSTVYTDIVKRNQIRKVDQLERIVRFAFDNIGRTFSATSISKYLKSENRSIDNETVYSYLKNLERAFILHRCCRYDIQGKEILKTQEKFYISDTALRYSMLGYTSESVAAMLENVVYIELLRRGYEVYTGQLLGGEIGFVAIKQEKKLYIQIALQIESIQTEQREYDRLLKIKDNYPKYVLRTDAFAGGNYEGIQTMHIADFLLSGEY
ncbi:MAG: ATP-binding protein [Eubacteriaceae bacterium]|nr:ATP-binding protein [Eubacteriaceae bacterium]